ncbi:uncharacterized protein LOC110621552 [Manihot esculenta]|uniref:uncharacterized protein LOC110621552 n=1 Tax=Manihot esculenta TaxID=3983 RepID=UPI000B5D200B|nr:uncharacterized protein LOC110621552 [Manihot esculenta]
MGRNYSLTFYLIRKELVLLPQIAIFLLWQIWKSRNAIIFQNNHQEVQNIVMITLNHYEDFSITLKECDVHFSPHFGSNNMSIHWSPSPPNIFKVNFDIVVDHNRPKGSSAILARDSSGKPWFCHCKIFENISDPLILEYLACREALLIAHNHNLEDTMVEGDSLMVIQTTTDHIISLIIQVLIKDIQELYKLFRLISFLHIDGNKTTYSLTFKAKHSLDHSSDFFLY